MKVLFMDGASKGYPRAAGGGGVIITPEGNLEINFTWGLGLKTNNMAKALALW